MPVRYEFERELNRLHKDIVKMGAFIEESITDMITALKTNDVELADHVIQNDDLIDDMERKIERECLIIIARQQPIATDLRDITSILKIVTDLERIADHCEDISVYIKEMANLEPVKEIVDTPIMADEVSRMIKDTIDAYVRKDLDFARQIIERDESINTYYDKIVNDVISIIESDSQKARAGTYLMFVAKYLERMADHATNICRWIIYYGTGEIQ